MVDTAVMDQSPYLVQALQGMQAAPPAQAAPSGPSLAQMQQMQQQKQAWEAANPGQSYMAHGIGQMGQNLAGAPGRVMDAVQGLGQVPGQAMSGLQALAQRFGAGGLPPTQNI